MKICRILLILLTITTLQGCVGIAAVGLGTAITKTVSDPRTMGRQVDDTTLQARVSDALGKVKALNAKNERIVATVYQGGVLLTGQVTNRSLMSLAEKTAKSVTGVERVYMQLRLAPIVSLSQMTQDTWITTKVRADLLAAKDLKSANFKVVTENGEVFLLGIVTHAQGKYAATIASKVSGVKTVTTLYQYIDS